MGRSLYQQPYCRFAFPDTCSQSQRVKDDVLFLSRDVCASIPCESKRCVAWFGAGKDRRVLWAVRSGDHIGRSCGSRRSLGTYMGFLHGRADGSGSRWRPHWEESWFQAISGYLYGFPAWTGGWKSGSGTVLSRGAEAVRLNSGVSELIVRNGGVREERRHPFAWIQELRQPNTSDELRHTASRAWDSSQVVRLDPSLVVLVYGTGGFG